MSQQQSPWLEIAYGWNYGENGWNTGMDSNLLKFSVMFDRNVDGVVNSLPDVVNGRAYFLTTDNRLYFAANSVWFSSPTPKWFEFKDRSTGSVYQFNGTNASLINSPAEVDSRLDAIEVTVASLGSAAFEDVSAFATQAELDISAADAQAYTDALREDITQPLDKLTLRGERALYITDAPYSVTGNNTPEDRLNLISALDAAAAAGKVVVVPARVYEFNDWIPLPDKLKIVFEPGAVWKLTAVTSLGGFVCGGYTAALVPRPFTDAEIHGISLDCSSIAGENGFNAINADNVKVYSPKVKSTLFSTGKLGGRAFQFEGAVVDGIHIYNPYIENCTIGINSQGDPSGGAEIARNINYYDVVMRNVDVPFNIDGQFASPETGTLINSSVFVHGAQLFNCGKLTFPGASSTTGGGIICGDRGYGLSISGLRVLNTAAYGGIGALVRGVIFNFRITDVHMDVPSCTAVFDHSATGFGAPSLADFPALVYAENVRFKGNLDFVVKSGGAVGRIGASKYDIEIDSSVASLSGITDIAGITTAYINLSLTDSGFKESGLRTLADLHTAGNTVGVSVQQYSEGVWTPVDASGAGLVFTSAFGYFVRNGRQITATFRLDYPATADTAAAIIGGLPFTSMNLPAVGSLSISYKSAAQLFSGNPVPNTQNVGLFTAAGASTKNNEMASTTLIGTVIYLSA